MLVAKQKRKENIAEYILYLYQVEDLIRAFKCDISLIEERLVTAYNVDSKTSSEILEWYENLLMMMEKERIKEKGHLQFLKNLIADVNEFHLKLMQTGKDKGYVQSFHSYAGLLAELKIKNPSAQDDVELALDTTYGYLLLKMKKAEISEGTVNAIKQLGAWLGHLSRLYKEFEAGDLEF